MTKHKYHQIISKLKSHKWVIIAILISLLTIIISVGGLIYSQQSWNSYESNYNQYLSSAKNDINKVILSVDSKSANRLNDIIKIKDKLTIEAKLYCEAPSLIKWQSFISEYSKKINNCALKKQNLSKLLLDLGELAGYLESEQKLANILSKANLDTNQSNSVNKWGEIEPFWRQAAIDTAKISDAYQFKSTKIFASDKLVKIADAWQQLCNANNAKNRQQYEEAHVNLNQAYTQLPTIGDYSKAEVDKLIANLNASYGKVY